MVAVATSEKPTPPPVADRSRRTLAAAPKSARMSSGASTGMRIRIAML
jgi:hypothetical protein